MVRLSAAGISAMMAFTVTRRRREIGIRSALGANARRVLGSIFARASAQVSAGIALGLIGTVALRPCHREGTCKRREPGRASTRRCGDDDGRRDCRDRAGATWPRGSAYRGATSGNALDVTPTKEQRPGRSPTGALFVLVIGCRLSGHADRAGRVERRLQATSRSCDATSACRLASAALLRTAALTRVRARSDALPSRTRSASTAIATVRRSAGASRVTRIERAFAHARIERVRCDRQAHLRSASPRRRASSFPTRAPDS